jgi:mediator of RNA polymerase II transcription subunit 12
MGPLIGRLSYLVKRLAYEQPSSLVLPRSWHEYSGILSSCLNLDEPADKVAFQTLMDRNVRVQPVKDCHKERPRLPQQRIISVLDAACSSHNLTALSEMCLSTIEDRAVLISRLLEWAATFFRHGLVRVYIAVRLLRKWKKLGIDVDSYTLSFLVGAGDKTGLDMVNVYHVIAELVRSQTFSVAGYLEWLVARGAVESYQPTKQQVGFMPRLDD